MRHMYEYTGCVLRFATIVIRNWHAFTYAVSEAKARSNLEYRAKRELGLLPNAQIRLDGKLKRVA